MQADEVFQNRDEKIAREIFCLLKNRQPGSSICPSEVARALAGPEAAWRALMPQVRQVAAQLAGQRQLEITQRGQAVDLASVRGPVRLRLPRGQNTR